MKKAIKILFGIIILIIIMFFSVRYYNEKKAISIEEEFNTLLNTEYVNIMDNSVNYIKREVREGSVVGDLYIPNESKYKGTVIVFGGSEGSNDGRTASFLANNGFETLALYYFGQASQNKVLDRIWLEFFEGVLEYIGDERLITIVGGSRGAELALLLSTYYDEIDNLVLYSPSAYVFQGARMDKVSSSWTYGGSELDFISRQNISKFDLLRLKCENLLGMPYNSKLFLSSTVKNTENLERCRIKSENTNANIILFYGDDDGIWDSKGMGAVIEEYAKNVIVYEYEGVGHDFMGPSQFYGILNGGVTEKNLKAYLDSNEKLLEQLGEWHK